jgi:opacity protein-like surface antigen
MKKILAALLLTLPTMAVAVDLEGFYITAKGGVSKTSSTGTINYTDFTGTAGSLQSEDLGTGTALGFSVGKYLNDNFRFELEATKRTGYDLDARLTTNSTFSSKAKIQTEALFINGFYDFQPFSISNMSITPYLGGGVGISRNKTGTDVSSTNGLPNGVSTVGDTSNQFAYKLSAGTLFSLTEQLSLDVSYQYVNLGEFEEGTEVYRNGLRRADLDAQKGANGGEIKSQELMVGLRYTFK